MPDPIDDYLDDVMRHAALPRDDARRVRGELREHLMEMLDAANLQNKPLKEILAMMNQQFGDPAFLGKGIAASRGRWRTWMKRTARQSSIAAAVLVTLLVVVRASVAQVFYVTGSGVAPAVPRGSRCVVYKLSSNYHAGDVIAFHATENPGAVYLGVLQSIDERSGDLIVKRNEQPAQAVPHANVVGRVFLNTR